LALAGEKEAAVRALLRRGATVPQSECPNTAERALDLARDVEREMILERAMNGLSDDSGDKLKVCLEGLRDRAIALGRIRKPEEKVSHMKAVTESFFNSGIEHLLGFEEDRLGAFAAPAWRAGEQEAREATSRARWLADKLREVQAEVVASKAELIRLLKEASTRERSRDGMIKKLKDAEAAHHLTKQQLAELESQINKLELSIEDIGGRDRSLVSGLDSAEERYKQLAEQYAAGMEETANNTSELELVLKQLASREKQKEEAAKLAEQAQQILRQRHLSPSNRERAAAAAK